MKNLKKLLFAAVLVGAAVMSAPKAAQATSTIPWCNQCAASGGLDCKSCCICDGNTITYCAIVCSQ